MIVNMNDELVKIRVENGETRFEMANKLGISETYLGSLERGQKGISKKILLRLIETYKLTGERKEIILKSIDNIEHAKPMWVNGDVREILEGIRLRYSETIHQMSSKLEVESIYLVGLEKGRYAMSPLMFKRLKYNYTLTEDEENKILTMYPMLKDAKKPKIKLTSGERIIYKEVSYGEKLKSGDITIGDVSRNIRLVNGITQYNMAKRLGYNATYLSHVERGRVRLTPKFVERFLREFELSEREIELLFKSSDEDNGENPVGDESISSDKESTTEELSLLDIIELKELVYLYTDDFGLLGKLSKLEMELQDK